jgi:hypothetical protein
MTHHWSNSLIILAIIGALIISAGCVSSSSPPATNQTQQNNTTLVPIPLPTPNPYGLDKDGYYIADMVSSFEIQPQGPPQFVIHPQWDINELNSLTGTPPGGWYFNVTRKQLNITSGGAAEFEGVTNFPVDTIIGIRTTNGVNTLEQYYSAPVIPGSMNETNLIRVRIPALNIHLDGIDNMTEGEIYETMTMFGPANRSVEGVITCDSISITYDPTHPLIGERNKAHSPGFGPKSHDPINAWWWTNTSTIRHTWNGNGDEYAPCANNGGPGDINGTVVPYPTYPRPARTCLKTSANGSGSVLIIC